MKISMNHELNTDPDTYWTKVFFDDDYNKAVNLEGLKNVAWEVISDQDGERERVRSIKVIPKQDAPAVLQKLIGNNFSYREEGRFDKASRRYSFKIIGSALTDKILISGEIRAEPAGPKKMRRVVEMSIEVKIFGVGGIAEKFVASSSQEGFEKSVPLTNSWIAARGL